MGTFDDITDEDLLEELQARLDNSAIVYKQRPASAIVTLKCLVCQLPIVSQICTENQLTEIPAPHYCVRVPSGGPNVEYLQLEVTVRTS